MPVACPLSVCVLPCSLPQAVVRLKAYVDVLYARLYVTYSILSILIELRDFRLKQLTSYIMKVNETAS